MSEGKREKEEEVEEDEAAKTELRKLRI